MDIAYFLGILSAVLAGIITATWNDVVMVRVQRPKLRLLEDEPEVAELWSGHAIRVTNTGQTVARGCQAMLSMPFEPTDLFADAEVARVGSLGLDPGKWNVSGSERVLLTRDNYRKVDHELLAWSQIGNPVQVDVYPNTVHMIDVCRFMKGPIRQLHVPSERGWSSLRGAFVAKDYRMTVTVVAENAKPVERVYVAHVQPGGDLTLEPVVQAGSTTT